jgi:hypothetical protein
MFRFSFYLWRACSVLFLVIFLSIALVMAQVETATVSGQVVDSSGLRVAGARINLVDIDRDTMVAAATDNSGIYRFPSVHPGRYRMQVTANGFRVIDVTNLIINVQDHLEQNFRMTVGSVSESITVNGGAPLIDAESATVSTVIDRQFAENLPMNGRSFQTLIQLTPGVVLTPNNGLDTGQFSVNGQRASSNYWTIDGASANVGIGTGATTSNGLGGSLNSFSVLGGTSSLISVDALQEFRIQTSTFAPEFGRTPGGQISIVTRSGSNEIHGTVFDFLRNDILDASSWFNGYTNNPPLPKAMERQNDFGGTFSGPIVKNKTFFFFSYEGLRLRLPQTGLTRVPDITSRQNAVLEMQPYLDAYPRPNGADDALAGVAVFNATFSNPATLDAYSIRLDHRLSDKLSLFARYNYSPSELDERGGTGSSLNTVLRSKIAVQTATVGLSWVPLSTITTDLRLNYSRTDSYSSSHSDSFGGAALLPSLPFPSPFTTQNATFSLAIISLGSSGYGPSTGPNARNQQNQLNLVDSVSLQKLSHSIKMGVDYRRLSPHLGGRQYSQEPIFSSLAEAEQGAPIFSFLTSNLNSSFIFNNLGLFAQDTWRMKPRLTLTYGIRWDVDFAPKSAIGPALNSLAGFNLEDLSQLTLAPAGTPPYTTSYENIAPRIGLAYQVLTSQKRQTVARGGFGVFYDLASSEVGNIAGGDVYPFGASSLLLGGTFPLSSAQSAAPLIVAPSAATPGTLAGFDPRLRLPYTLQWNIAIDQGLGDEQTLTASYVGSAGRRLIQTALVNAPNTAVTNAELVTNSATSNYNALQLQYQRQLQRGLQALASYTWAHSIDTASAGSAGNGANVLAALNPAGNRGSSDFDIRHAFSVGLTYDMPKAAGGALAKAILRNWSSENVFEARSAPPVNIYYSFYQVLSSGFITYVRPNLVPGESLYLHGSQFPGSKAFNAAAFSPPPIDPNGNPVGEGDLGRNALRGFGSWQWDFAIHRDFPIHESLKLQFRAELFNVLNHPSFAQPVGDLYSPSAINPQFGSSAAVLAQSLSGSAGAGGFNALYQMGGPRSMQFALKLLF